MGDSHAWADTCAWNPHVSLSPLLKHKEQVETHAKHMVNNPRGMLPTHLHAFERRDKLRMCGFSWGTAMQGRTTLHGSPMHGCPPYWNAIDMMLTYATHKVSNPWGSQSAHRDPFGRCNRLPMCSFLWGTAVHGRTPVHGTPMCRCPPFWNTKNRWKLMLNTW